MSRFGAFMLGVALSAALCLIGGWMWLESRPEPVPETITEYIHDTTTIVHPEYRTRVVLRDTIIAVHDTTQLHDTCYIALAVEQKHYSDTSYDAWVSGISPRLDSIRLYNTTIERTITKPVPVRCRWGIGVHGGVGVTYAGGFKTAPYIGVGVQYNLLQW